MELMAQAAAHKNRASFMATSCTQFLSACAGVLSASDNVLALSWPNSFSACAGVLSLRCRGPS